MPKSYGNSWWKYCKMELLYLNFILYLTHHIKLQLNLLQKVVFHIPKNWFWKYLLILYILSFIHGDCITELQSNQFHVNTTIPSFFAIPNSTILRELAATFTKLNQH